MRSAAALRVNPDHSRYSVLPSEYALLSSEEKDEAIARAMRGTTGVGRRVPTPVERIAVLPDPHIPYQDHDRLAEALEDAKRCDRIVLLGDLIDAYTISSFDRDPTRKLTLADEIEEARGVLSGMRQRNRTKPIHLIEGNHEQRFKRYLHSKAPELVGLRGLSIPEQLGVSDLNIQWHSRSGFALHGRRFKHGDAVKTKAGRSADAEIAAHFCSGFSGHTHRLGPAFLTDREGRRWEWWECGHLANLGAAEYVNSPDWQAGYVIAEVADDGSIRVKPVYL